MTDAGPDARGAAPRAADDDASGRVAAGIALSRLTGLVRERALVHYLGYGAAADAFTTAARIPNLLRQLLGDGVLSASFVPVHSRLLSEGREREAAQVAGAVVGLLAAATGALALLGIVVAEPLTGLVAGGLRARPETFALTVTLVRVLFPAVGLLTLSAWCLGVLNSHRRFFLSYVAPVVMNVAQVAVLVVVGQLLLADAPAGTTGGTAAQDQLAVALAWGTVAGGLLQFLVQVPAVLRASPGIRPSLRWRLPGVRTIGRRLGPVVGARGVVRLSGFVQLLLASHLAVGALAVLRYGQLLYTLPVSLFGMAAAAAHLPALSRSDLDHDDVVARLQHGLARIAAYVVPTTAAYLVVGDLLVATLLQTGAFDRVGVVAVWLVAGAYALGLTATTASRLLQSALYGLGDTATPARASVVRILVSVVLGAVLMVQLDRVVVDAGGLVAVGDLPAFRPLPAELRAATTQGTLRLGAAGLGLAAAVASWVELRALRRAVTARVGPVRVGGDQLRPILLAAAPAAVAGLAVRPLALGLPPLLGGLAGALAVGLPYLLLARRLGVDEADALLRRARRLVRRR